MPDRATSRERRSLPFLTVDDEVSGNHLAIARWHHGKGGLRLRSRSPLPHKILRYSH